MSAETHDVHGVHEGPLPSAQPAVDVLPMPGARKTKRGEFDPVAQPDETGWPAAAAEQAPGPLAPEGAWPSPAADPTWSTTAPAAADGSVDPSWPAPAQPSPTWEPGAQGVGGPVDPAAAAVPVATPPLVPQPVSTPDAAAPEAPKKFFGMQVRRGKKQTQEPEAVAAWPTDATVPVVADAWQQPESPNPGGYDQPVVPESSQQVPASAPQGLYAAMDDAAAAASVSAPVQAPVVAAPEPAQAVTAEPDPVHAYQEQVRVVRAQLESSEGARLAAESRAEQALAYARQAQTQLEDAEKASRTKVEAAEAKSRTAANDAQDWQIRHREAETTIAELSQSLAGAEKRLAEINSERSELMAALDDVTAPDHDHVETS
jgi:hypothetical protein